MPLQLRRRNGSVTPFRNSEYLPFYYFIPKSILKKCGAELNAIPRNPREIFKSRETCEFIESDLFLLLIIDAAAYLVWPHMGHKEYEKAQMERLAEICGLSLSEYLRKRGLGYAPRPLLDVSFYQLYTQLCEVCNQPISTDSEVALLELITDIRSELLLPKKQTAKEVAAWLQQDSGQSKDG